MNPINSFVSDGTFLDEQNDAENIKRKFAKFWLLVEKLYQRLFGKPYMSCVHLEAVNGLLTEVHEGVCRSHTGGRSLSPWAMTQVYWWLNVQRDVAEYIKNCDQCQRHAPNIYQPGGIQNPISSPWPFAQ